MNNQDWQSLLANLYTPFEHLIEDKQKAKDSLKKALFAAIDELAPKADAVALSGGVDSCFLLLHARQANGDIKAITVGLKDAPDLIEATEFVNKFYFENIIHIISLQEAKELIEEVRGIVPKKDAVSIGVGAVTLQVCKLAYQQNLKAVITGLGSEELFAGYQRHRDAAELGSKELHEECWRGLYGLYQRDLTRDLPLAAAENITLLCPFLHPVVIKAAMAIHPKLKLNDAFSKVILREIAQENGVEPRWAWRKKKAAQYGSAMHKVLAKMAKEKGLSISQYLEA